MSLDVIMVVDGKWIMEDENGVCHWTGNKGYLRNPSYGFPHDESGNPVELDFFKETPKVLDHLLNICLSGHKEIEPYIIEIEKGRYKQKGHFFKRRKEKTITELIDMLNELKSILEKIDHEQPKLEMRRFIEMIDFFKFGIELQSAGKHPKVLVL